MGTNYYAKVNVCPNCKKEDREIHLGKSSGGWKFMFRAHEEYYKDFPTFCEFIQKPNVEIRDEYGEKRTPEALIDFIEAKQSLKSHNQLYGGGKDVNGFEFFDYEFS